MMRAHCHFPCLILAAVLLAACADTTAPPAMGIDEPDPDLGLRDGYRSAADTCRATSETAFTVEFLDDAADLVACPTGDPSVQDLIDRYGARMVTQTESYTLFSVPRR